MPELLTERLGEGKAELQVLQARESWAFWGNGQEEVFRGTSGQGRGGYNFPQKSESIR